jgi:hypothetical protein
MTEFRGLEQLDRRQIVETIEGGAFLRLQTGHENARGPGERADHRRRRVSGVVDFDLTYTRID